MTKREISNLELKIRLTKEYLRNGGTQQIYDAELLDLLSIEFNKGKADPNTVSSRANAFMLALLGSHMMPPPFHAEHISEYASTLQKANNFDQENIDTEEQFDKIYDKYKVKDDTLFRGQREAKWRLYSKIQRQWIIEKLFIREESYQKLIERLVETGKTNYSPQIQELLSVQHIDSVNSISVLGYLQHHGCPTPLLDWTYKFQNALYFALDGVTPNTKTLEIEDYCSVYFIEEKHFEGGNLRTIIKEGLDTIEQPELFRLIAQIANGDEEKRIAMEKKFAGRKLFDHNRISGSGLISYMTKIENLINFPITYFCDKDANSGILFSLNNSKNILNQAGVFTWNSDPSKPLEMVGDEQFREDRSDEDTDGYKFCSCFNIHKKLLDHARKRLEADGITTEFIYPTPELSTWEVFEKSTSPRPEKLP